MFAQQSLQPKVSPRCYASVSYALQNKTVFKSTQNRVSVSDGSQTDSGRERRFSSQLAVLGTFDNWCVLLTPVSDHLSYA